MFRSLATSLFIFFLLFAAHATPALGISVSYSAGDSGSVVSSTERLNMDDTASLREATMLDSDKLYQTRQASGSGTNSIKQQLSGNGYSVENSIDSVGALSAATSAVASSEGVDLSQQVAGTGELSASIQGSHGDDSAGQEASVMGGVLSSSQSLSASTGDGVSASQATKMAGVIGRVSSGAISSDKAMLASGSFLGAGTLEAKMSAQAEGQTQSQASVAVDGAEWLKQSDLGDASQDGVGMAVEGLRLDKLGDVGSFTMQAASMGRADYEKDKADRAVAVKAEQAVSSGISSEEDGVGSTVMYLNNPNAYILAGWKWTQNNPQIKMYLKRDANFNNEGLDAVATKNAIEAAANTWDDAVAQNLFADSNLVTVTEDPNIKTDTKDGYNTHGWKPITEGLAVSRTFYSTTKVGGYYPALESDVTYNSDYQWATNGGNYDVQSVAAHEMGHTIGLGDLYGKPEYAGDTDQVMHYYTGVKHNLGLGDRTGAQILYGSPIPISRYIGFRVCNGQYVCAEGGGGRELLANRNWIQAWETFGIVDLGNGKVALRASNGQYVCAEGGGGRELVANRNWIQAWETFSLIDLGNNKIALQANNGQYVCAEDGGGRELLANRNWIQAWETFNSVNPPL